MRRFITTEKKRKQLNALWRKYERSVDRCHELPGALTFKRTADLRAEIEDFIYDNGGTLE